MASSTVSQQTGTGRQTGRQFGLPSGGHWWKEQRKVHPGWFNTAMTKELLRFFIDCNTRAQPVWQCTDGPTPVANTCTKAKASGGKIPVNGKKRTNNWQQPLNTRLQTGVWCECKYRSCWSFHYCFYVAASYCLWMFEQFLIKSCQINSEVLDLSETFCTRVIRVKWLAGKWFSANLSTCLRWSLTGPGWVVPGLKQEKVWEEVKTEARRWPLQSLPARCTRAHMYTLPGESVLRL